MVELIIIKIMCRAELNHMPTSVYAVYGMPGKSDLLQITRADMTRLHPGRFLNDTLIEFYTRYDIVRTC